MPPNLNIRPSMVEESLLEATPYYDYEISTSDLFGGALQIVSFVFPSWKQSDIDFVQCKDGITNQLVKVTYRPTNFSVLVRTYGKGSELIIDRNQEIINIITLSSYHMCPPLYARFKNGLMYGFIQGRVSTVEQLAEEKTARWIAKKLGQWHKVSLPAQKTKQTLWSTLFKWLDRVPQKYNDETTQALFEKHFDMKQVREELVYLIDKLEKIDCPIVFSHNDLLFGNIIYDDEKEEAHFIDYEYGCHAYRGFDIGNHFNEFAGFECEYWRYPTKEFQLKWFDWYLTEYNGVPPTEEEKEKLYKEVSAFSLASHYYWGLWAMIQAMVSDIDFNYMEYAVLRLNEYHKLKDQVLS